MKYVYYAILIVTFGLVIAAAIYMPDAIINNTFLRGFINHEILNTQGVILAITLASIANLHIAFNKIEEDFGERRLAETRKQIRHNAYGLVFTFVSSVVLVFVRPYFDGMGTIQALIDGSALWLLLLSIIILIDIMDTVFALPPLRRKPNRSEDGGRDN